MNAMQRMINDLIKIADLLDNSGKAKLASEIDSIIRVLAESNIVSLQELESLTGQDLTETVKKMITFELTIEPAQDGQGNTVKARPQLHDKWTDGLVLGDSSQYPGLQGKIQ